MTYWAAHDLPEGDLLAGVGYTAEGLANLGDFALRDSFKPVTDSIREMFGEQRVSYWKEGVPVNSMFDRAALYGMSRLPFFKDLIRNDAENPGGQRVNPAVMAAYRMMTPLSVEAKGWGEPILTNPAIRDGEVKAEELAHTLAWMVAQGFAIKERRHDPAGTLEHDQKFLKTRTGSAVREAKRSLPATFLGVVEGTSVPAGASPAGGGIDLGNLKGR